MIWNIEAVLSLFFHEAAWAGIPYTLLMTKKEDAQKKNMLLYCSRLCEQSSDWLCWKWRRRPSKKQPVGKSAADVAAFYGTARTLAVDRMHEACN